MHEFLTKLEALRPSSMLANEWDVLQQFVKEHIMSALENLKAAEANLVGVATAHKDDVAAKDVIIADLTKKLEEAAKLAVDTTPNADVQTVADSMNTSAASLAPAPKA